MIELGLFLCVGILVINTYFVYRELRTLETIYERMQLLGKELQIIPKINPNELQITPKINPNDGTVVMDGGVLKYVSVPHDKLIPFLRELRKFLVELGVHPNWATIYTVSVITNEFMECVARGQSVFANGPETKDLKEFLSKCQD